MQSSISFFDAQTRKKNPIRVGSGTYNDAYLFPADAIKDEFGSLFPPMILKLPKAIFPIDDLKINASARQMKKWNAINPQYRDYVRAQDGYRMFVNHPFKSVDIIKGILYLSCLSNIYLKATYMLDNGLVEHRLFVNVPHIITEIVNGVLPLSIDYQNYIFSMLKLPRQSILVPQIQGKSRIPDVILARAVLKIYLETRCIIADACSGGNFLHDNASNQPICVDLDHAIHRDSPVSQEISYYESLLDYHSYVEYWDDCEQYHGYKQTVMVIRALFYLEKHLSSDLVKDEYLRIDFISVIHELYKRKISLTAQLCIDILNILEAVNHDRDTIVSEQNSQELHRKLMLLVLFRDDACSEDNFSIVTRESVELFGDASASETEPEVIVRKDISSISALSDSGLFSMLTASPYSEIDELGDTPHQSSTETMNL